MKNSLVITGLRINRNANFHLHIKKLNVSQGKVLGVVGPNGSGKTTLIEALAGIITPNEGEIKVEGRKLSNNLAAHRANVGYIPDDEEWYIKELTAKEYFKLLSSVYKKAGVTSNCLERADQLAEALQFKAFGQRLDTLSHGNKKKVEIIAGLMHEPSFVIIDELRNGLDPIAILAAEELIRKIAKDGATIVAATHDLWWAQRIADETLLLMNGRIQKHEPTKDLVKRFGSLEKLFISLSPKL